MTSRETTTLQQTLSGRRCAVGELLADWAQQRPDRVCCAIDDRHITYAEMDHRANVLAAGAAVGVAKGDRVATLASNRVEIVELFHGLARAGAIQVPLNAYLKGTFLRHQLAHSRAQVLITDQAGCRAVEPMLDQLPELETIILLDAASGSPRWTCRRGELATRAVRRRRDGVPVHQRRRSVCDHVHVRHDRPAEGVRAQPRLLLPPRRGLRRRAAESPPTTSSSPRCRCSTPAGV